MADDLDDFFAEVEDVAANAVAADEKEEEPNDDPTKEQEEPPAKKARVDANKPPAPILPRGVVVASASSAITAEIKPEKSEVDEIYEAMLQGETAQIAGKRQGQASSSSYATKTPTSSSTGLAPPTTSIPAVGPTTTANGGSSAIGPVVPQRPSNGGTKQNKPIARAAAGKVWVDPTLNEWPENDYRIFVGNLAKDVTDEQLHAHFATKYASLAKSKVVVDAKTGVSKGYGFCSFLQPLDCAKAIREMDQTWLSSRPIRIKRSDWKGRNLNEKRKQEKKQKKQRMSPTGLF